MNEILQKGTYRRFVERYIFNPYDFIEGHIKYTERKFNEFLKRTDSFITLKDKTILELGPGGSIGFGLLALQNGAKRYHALDNGIHSFITRRQLQGYRQLLHNDNQLLDSCFSERGKKGGSLNTEKIEYISTDQNSKYPLPDESVDIIYSCAVLEHVHNLDICFSEMARVLKRGGIMSHEVDLRDHIFSQKSLWFLTISDFWFKTFFSETGGYVNRKRLSFYKKLAHIYGLRVVAFECTILSDGTGVTPKLRQRYTDDDIEVLSFNMLLQKT